MTKDEIKAAPERSSAGSVELKPCPFCGSDAFMSNTGTCWVRCTSPDCCAEGPTADSEWQAAVAWNKRIPTPAQSSQVLDALRELEEANDRLAGKRTDSQYLSMIDAGQGPELQALDNARRKARAALAAQPPAAPVEIKELGLAGRSISEISLSSG